MGSNIGMIWAILYSKGYVSRLPSGERMKECHLCGCARRALNEAPSYFRSLVCEKAFAKASAEIETSSVYDWYSNISYTGDDLVDRLECRER